MLNNTSSWTRNLDGENTRTEAGEKGRRNQNRWDQLELKPRRRSLAVVPSGGPCPHGAVSHAVRERERDRKGERGRYRQTDIGSKSHSVISLVQVSSWRLLISTAVHCHHFYTVLNILNRQKRVDVDMLFEFKGATQVSISRYNYSETQSEINIILQFFYVYKICR